MRAILFFLFFVLSSPAVPELELVPVDEEESAIVHDEEYLKEQALKIIKDSKLFSLYNGCKPMMIFVSSDDTDEAPTEAEIRVIAEGRLRAARLYEKVSLNSFFEVVVRTTSTAFLVVASYNKRGTDDASGVNSLATTWDDAAFGSHGGNSEYILNAVSNLMDRFILEYMRVNEQDC